MKRLAINGILVALALVLSFIERGFPLVFIVPIPGVKLGLANVIGLFALVHFGVRDAYVITIVRCLLGAFMFGSMSSLLFSLGGGLLAVTAMSLVYALPRTFVGIPGVSIAGAAAHNIGQVIMASFTFHSMAVFGYLPMLLVAGAVTGCVTALLAVTFFRYFNRTGLAGQEKGDNRGTA